MGPSGPSGCGVTTTPTTQKPKGPSIAEFPDLSLSDEELSEYIIRDEDGSYTVDEERMETEQGSEFVKKFWNALEITGIYYVIERGKGVLLGKSGEKIVETAGEEALVSKPGWFSKMWGSNAIKTLVGATIAYFFVRLATSYMNERNADPINLAALVTAGVLTAYEIVAVLPVLGSLFPSLSVLLSIPGPGWIAAAIVLAVAAITFFFTFQVFSKEIIHYSVSAWQPPDAGQWCEKCNELPTGCSEYQCRSFGKGCSLINEGSEYEECVWEFQDDRIPPVIYPLEGILEAGLIYEEFELTSPPERGMRINDTSNDDKCIPAFTSLTLGVQTDENAICRWDYERRESFDQMVDYMNQGSAATINHTLYLPNSATASQESLENIGISIEEDREYGFFIKCKDVNGNENPLHFLVEFCLESGPDLDAPEILGTNYVQDSYIQFNVSSLPLQVYTNEPADCKWDHDDLEYDNMAYNMSWCSENVENYLFGFSYGCTGNLTGFQDRQENNFYIRCKDKPWWNEGDEGKRYENRESYVLNLMGTQPLVINSITVDGEESGAVIKGSSDEIKVVLEVTTFAGAENGKSKCSYLSGGSYYNFYNDGNTGHVVTNKQRLWLVPGSYAFPILCTDAAENSDEGNISFTVETDTLAPTVVRVYKKSNNLKIITDEEASCVYDVVDCTYVFDDGLAMQSHDDVSHLTDWNKDKTFYIKCKDEYNNQPAPNACSIIARPFEI